MTPSAGSDRARRAAIRLLRWYPIRWRARYEREMKALLEDMPVGWGQVANVAGTAAREWLSLRAFGWPSPSAAKRIQTIRWWRFVALTYAVDLVARLVAAVFVDAHVKVSTALQFRVSLLSWFVFIRLAVALAFRLKVLQRSRWAATKRRWPGFLSDREIVIWMVLFLPFFVINHMASGEPLNPLSGIFLLWLWPYFLLQFSDRKERLNRVYHQSLRHSLRILNIPRASE